MSCKKMFPTMRCLHPLFSIFFIRSLVFGHDATPDPSRCASSEYRCGDQTFEISYPFLKPTSLSYCGHPDFEVECSSDNKSLLARIDDKRYQVNSINYGSQLVHVTDPDFLDQSCHQTFANTSISPSLFSYSSDDANLTVLFNCSSSLELVHIFYNITCPESDSDHRSFYGLANNPLPGMVDIWQFCDLAIVPINGSFVDNLRTRNYMGNWLDLKGAVQSGYGLNWKPGDKWCSKCTDSKGICWSDPDSKNSSACYCSNGTSSVNGVCVSINDSVPGKNVSKKPIFGVVAGVGGAFIVLGGCLALFLHRRRKRRLKANLSNLLSNNTSSKISSKRDPESGETNYITHIFSYDELDQATDSFNASRELGDGGFGTVYKGKLRDGRTVAVKRLYENNYRRLEQFMNEVEILSRLRHQNLVTLYGCTSRHSRELLLVYEYIPNGTLADHLHGPLTSNGLLRWPTRMSIAIETAEALAYLHAVEPQIIHRDVKTNNILLDNNFHVKVADFGLSRLFPLDATHVSTAPQGTPGYVDPEYHQCYQLTDKSDVYSFGVVLVELISSKPAVDISRHRHEINLANMAITKIQNGQIDQLVDVELGYCSDPEVTRMINQVAELAFRCLQADGDMRPSIKEALEVLGNIECRGNKAEKEAEANEVQTREESQLLKNVLPFSPDSVTDRWSSRSTMSNTSA